MKMTKQKKTNSKYRFADEIKQLLQVPPIIFILLAAYVRFIKLSRRQKTALIQSLEKEQQEYFLLMLACDTFSPEPKKDRAVNLLLTYVSIKQELNDNLAVEPEKVRNFLGSLKREENTDEQIRDNSYCGTLLEESKKTFDIYLNRENNFYKEFSEIASSAIATCGSLYLSKLTNQVRHLN